VAALAIWGFHPLIAGPLLGDNDFVIVPIRFTLLLHKAAQADLEAIWAADPHSAGVLLALLQQIRADPVLLGLQL